MELVCLPHTLYRVTIFLLHNRHSLSILIQILDGSHLLLKQTKYLQFLLTSRSEMLCFSVAAAVLLGHRAHQDPTSIAGL